MYYRTYTCLTERILVSRSTYWYFRSYMYITELILVLRNLYLSYETYTSISEHILVFWILYVYYKTYTCILDLIHVLQSIYLSYGSYTCVTKLILVFQILFLYEVPVGTISQNISESYHIQGQIRLIQIRALVLRRYKSHQIHIPGLYRFRIYPKTNRVVGSYQSHL